MLQYTRVIRLTTQQWLSTYKSKASQDEVREIKNVYLVRAHFTPHFIPHQEGSDRWRRVETAHRYYIHTFDSFSFTMDSSLFATTDIAPLLLGCRHGNGIILHWRYLF